MNPQRSNRRTIRFRILLVSAVIVAAMIYWWCQPGAPFVTPPFEVGGTIDVVIVDENDERIPNATVVAQGLRAVQDPGSFYSWIEEEHGPMLSVTSNEDGIAKITYPKWVGRKSGFLTTSVVAGIDHPDYCLETNVECDVPQAGTITPIPRARLRKGGRLRIKAFREGSSEPLANFHSIVSGDYYHLSWKTDGDARRSPVYAPGPHVIRITDHTDPEAIQFSQPIIFEAVAGKTEDLEIPLRPGIVVRGKLNVPKPVKEGYVIVSELDMAAGMTSTHDQAIVWQTWTKVAENGEFEFRSLPPTTTIQLLAWCDGYVYQVPQSSTIPPYAVSRKFTQLPQFFAIKADQTFCLVEMVPTANCAVSVTGIDGKPVEGVHVEFYPNVAFGINGSTMFGWARRDDHDQPGPDLSFADLVREATKKFSSTAPKSPDDLRLPFGGLTDANGKILIKNLPGRGQETMYVTHDVLTVRGSVKPPFDGRQKVNLQLGETVSIDVVVEPKPLLTPSMLAPPPTARPPGTLQRVIQNILQSFGW